MQFYDYIFIFKSLIKPSINISEDDLWNHYGRTCYDVYMSEHEYKDMSFVAWVKHYYSETSIDSGDDFELIKDQDTNKRYKAIKHLNTLEQIQRFADNEMNDLSDIGEFVLARLALMEV